MCCIELYTNTYAVLVTFSFLVKFVRENSIFFFGNEIVSPQRTEQYEISNAIGYHRRAKHKF